MEPDDLLCSRNAWEEKGSLVVLLLAERAPSEGPRSTRAIEDRPGHPLKRETSELGGIIWCSLDARSEGQPGHSYKEKYRKPGGKSRAVGDPLARPQGEDRKAVLARRAQATRTRDFVEGSRILRFLGTIAARIVSRA